MADWSGTLMMQKNQVEALDAFIHEPDTRQSDIFGQGTLDAGEGQPLDWIIKHDIFEGVVLHLSLMAEGHTSFLAGHEEPLSRASDLFQTYALEHDGKTYALTIKTD